MAENSSNNITYYLSVSLTDKSYLGAVRHFQQLKIAFDGDTIWLKDFTQEQVQSLEVKTIPHKKVYYSNSGKLFLQGSLLPARNEPSLLWTPIERGLPIQLPSFNHNYFGIDQQIKMNLIPSENEQEAICLIAPIPLLEEYITTAPAIRLQHLKWALLTDNTAIIMGKPLLPVQGDVYWQHNNFLLPAGWETELHLLADALNFSLNADNKSLIVWFRDGSYLLLNKNYLQPLSIGSFRLSTKK